MNTSYARSICSTCEHLTYCCINTEKTQIHSCSEYDLQHPSTIKTYIKENKVA